MTRGYRTIVYVGSSVWKVGPFDSHGIDLGNAPGIMASCFGDSVTTYLFESTPEGTTPNLAVLYRPFPFFVLDCCIMEFNNRRDRSMTIERNDFAFFTIWTSNLSTENEQSRWSLIEVADTSPAGYTASRGAPPLPAVRPILSGDMTPQDNSRGFETHVKWGSPDIKFMLHFLHNAYGLAECREPRSCKEAMPLLTNPALTKSWSLASSKGFLYPIILPPASSKLTVTFSQREWCTLQVANNEPKTSEIVVQRANSRPLAG
ncbi:hypothetical protein HD554DRAFT_2036435 [Boletus coccyginus]|nr:hypothetical protein HD554DRAFT_2036435 [Boletus coccyginus]